MLIRPSPWLTLMFLGAVILGCGTGEPPPGQFRPIKITLSEVPGKNLKELDNDRLVFVDPDGVKWIAPQGTWTDGATVPRLALPITDGRFDEHFLKAAVVHDAYCQGFNAERCPDQYQKRPWKEVHKMFYEGCLAGDTPTLTAKLMFAAVWLCGPRWDDPDPYRQQVSDEALTRGFIGCKDWIERENPTVEEIVADIDSREALLAELHQFERETISALENRDWAKATEVLGEQEAVLAKALDKSPDDLMLLSFEGYLHKNKAIIGQARGEEDHVEEELGKAEEAFNRVIEMEPEDPGALNGLGSVSIVRRDWDTAEGYVRKAIEIAPDYQAAKDDLELITSRRGAAPSAPEPLPAAPKP